MDHDWRLVPAAVAAWIGAGIGTAGLPGWWLLIPGGLLLTGVIWAWRSALFSAVVALGVLLVVAGLAFLRAGQLHTETPAQLAAQGAAASVKLKLVSEPILRPAKGPKPELAVARAELIEITARGQRVRAQQAIVLFASGKLARSLADAVIGAEYQVQGILAPAEPDTPLALVLRARSISTPLSSPGLLAELVNRLRAGLRTAAAVAPPEPAALLPSLVVGDTAAISEQLSQEFRVTSLTHLLAVSGANLAILLSVVLTLARTVGLRGWWIRLISLGCVGLFVLVCRSEPSVVRAAAMGLVAVSAIGISRGRRSIRNLALAVLGLMLLDPWLARSWGFALSVAACFGIIWLSPGWIEAMTSWLPRWLAEAFAVPLAAQLATQPLIVALSGQVSVVGVLANVLAAPFVAPATILGLAAMCLSWLPPLAAGVALVGSWCVQPIIWIARAGAQLPAAAVSWPTTTLGICLAVLGSLALAGLLGAVLKRRWLALLLILGLLLASFVRPAPLGWPGNWQAVFCDVGQGDATVLRADEQTAVLVDTGPEPGPVLSCLDSLGITRIPLVVITHFHSDHLGGLPQVVQRYRPAVILVSPLATPNYSAAAMQELANESGAQLSVANPGEVFQLGQLSWTTVSAWQPGDTNYSVFGSSSQNNASVVGLAEVAGLRLLLPGDVEPEGQRAALQSAQRLGISLQAQVLKLPHHGSARQEPQFFTATGAVLAVASAGKDNGYGHPSSTALRLAASQGMQLVRTDLNAAIAIGLEPGGLSVRVQR